MSRKTRRNWASSSATSNSYGRDRLATMPTNPYTRRRLNDASALVGRKNEGDILTTEAEAVRQRRVDLGRAGLIGNIVQVALGIGSLVIDRRGQHIVANRQQTGDGFNAAGCGDQMAHHALDA